jgi:hypothetical protein
VLAAAVTADVVPLADAVAEQPCDLGGTIVALGVPG